jgi:proline racemase
VTRQTKSVFESWNWQPPAGWLRLETLDMHTGGEPLRVFVSGLPALEGKTVLEKRRYFRDHYDYIRTGTMWEPRGHADMYGAVLTASSDADFDVFFLHNEGYSTMCGHAIIALTTLALETGLTGKCEITFSVPAGLIAARARLENGRARDVSFRNVPSFAYAVDQRIDVPGIGRVHFDIAYGGAFYALVDAQPLGLGLVPAEFNQLVDYGRKIKQAVMSAMAITHPFESDLSFLYGTIFTGPAQDAGCHSRNVCIFADGELDRSPTGSGVSARAALLHARGDLRIGERLTIESILGTRMTVAAASSMKFGPYDAVIPEVGGTASIIGRNEFYFDPEDPLRGGFILR